MRALVLFTLQRNLPTNICRTRLDFLANCHSQPLQVDQLVSYPFLFIYKLLLINSVGPERPISVKFKPINTPIKYDIELLHDFYCDVFSLCFQWGQTWVACVLPLCWCGPWLH